jgi:vancomycin resistance protein YoaR
MKKIPAVIVSLSSVFLALPGTPVFAQPTSLTLRVADVEESVPSETLSSWFDRKTSREPRTDTRSEIENTVGCPYDPLLCEFSLSRSGRLHTSVTISEHPRENDIRNYLASLSTRTIREPINARFTVTDEAVVPETESTDGIRLKEDAGFIALSQALIDKKTSVDLPTEITPAAIRSGDAAKLGLKELIGVGKTDFRGSPKNRIHNFTRGVEQFHGLLIAPNEEFSFVKYLGDVDAEHGYLPELVIKNNKTEPEFGGGICQVSSTMFRAAFNTGLKVTARKNHAYPVSYYKPYGMDATIYIPKPDLTFVNNTPGYILIQGAIEGTTLSFRFYGTDDGRTVSIDGPHILESNPDGSMKTTFTEKVTDAKGNVIIDDSFPSAYKSPSLFPHFQILTEKPKDMSKQAWQDYLVQKADYYAKLAAANAEVAKAAEATSLQATGN